MSVWCTRWLSLTEEPSPGQSLQASWCTPATLTDQRPGGGREAEKEWEKKTDKKSMMEGIRLNIRGERDWDEIVAQVSVWWQKQYFLHHCHLSCHQYTHSFLLLSNLFLHIHLTGRQALLAELAMRFMLSIGLKRRSLLSSPRYAFNPSNSWLEEKRRLYF